MFTGPLWGFFLSFTSNHALLSIPGTIKIHLTLDTADQSIKTPAQLRMHVPTENSQYPFSKANNIGDWSKFQGREYDR